MSKILNDGLTAAIYRLAGQVRQSTNYPLSGRALGGAILFLCTPVGVIEGVALFALGAGKAIIVGVDNEGDTLTRSVVSLTIGALFAPVSFVETFFSRNMVVIE